MNAFAPAYPEPHPARDRPGCFDAQPAPVHPDPGVLLAAVGLSPQAIREVLAGADG